MRWWPLLLLPIIACLEPDPTSSLSVDQWRCPDLSTGAGGAAIECSCDLPHTLRCTGTGAQAIKIVGRKLARLGMQAQVSLLDCTLQNITELVDTGLDGVTLHGLVVSSGELRYISKKAFSGLAGPLQALGLPNNQLSTVPTEALSVLPALDRLDLSHNRLRIISNDSFKGLYNLTFLELSDNSLSTLSQNAFKNLPQLRILRLRGNKLTMPTIMRLNPLNTLQELDLSCNNLVGPVGPTTFPKMKQLRDLQIAHNMLSSIRRGALEGLTNLTSLILHHNQIDVLEDHAFSQLSSLVRLDLAHNRIVAVSGASLAHLTNLTELDLRHNFLRALTADLVLPLTKLRDLRLDDNDIAIIASDALKPYKMLSRLTLADNPLNCDCSLTDFAIWLSNSTSISKEDKSTAVCTTPPSLENGLLTEVPLSDLLCGEEEPQEPLMAPAPEPVAKSHVSLQKFEYDGATISLQWSVDVNALPYTCDAIFVYEEQGANEVLLLNDPLKCNSSELKNPLSLNVTVPGASDLQFGHRYRYCVVLLEANKSDEISLVLGCSDVIQLIPNVKLPKKEVKEVPPKIISVQANLTAYGRLTLQVALYPTKECVLNIAVLQQGSLLSQRRINCSDPRYSFVGLHEGPYRVCANVVGPGPPLNQNQRPRCVTAMKRELPGLSGLDVIIVGVFLILIFILVVVVFGVRKILFKPKIQTHQCFLPPEDNEHTHQHSRYVKLQATTKL